MDAEISTEICEFMNFPLDIHKHISVISVTVNKDILTREQVVELLRKMQGKRTGRELAAELGITPAYLSDVLSGKRWPGPSILEKIGLTQEMAYRRKTA